jgi:hypothetical protein
MTLAQLKTKANAKLATFWTALQNRQDAYFAKHGKYFQLLAGSDLTIDGADTTFSGVSPSDEVHTVDIDYAWSDTVPFKIEVHEWVGADKGYTAIVTAENNGSLYQRSRNSLDVDSGWYVFNPVIT